MTNWKTVGLVFSILAATINIEPLQAKNPSAKPAKKTVGSSSAESSPGRDELRRRALKSALDRKVLFAFELVPFDVALQFFEVALDGHRIRLDRVAIRRAGISLKQSVTLRLGKRTVRDHFLRILKQSGLTYRIDRKGIVIEVPTVIAKAKP